MDQQENTKSGPEQNQVQAEPEEQQKPEPPRKCKICGGPNPSGCGCEAKARIDADMPTKEDEQPESEASPLPPAEEQKVLDEVHIAKDIKSRVEIMSEGFETLCLSLYDTNNLLKIMAGDLITIRKHLTKEDEEKSDV